MENLERAIREHRSANVTVSLIHDGVPLSHRDVQVRQKRHQFLFGSNWGESALPFLSEELTGEERERAELRSERFFALFNQVTLPFYWARFEPRRGQPETERLLHVARWYAQHGCTLKGHPLCWHTLTADWLLSMRPREILQAQLGRIRREVAAFAGLIDQWDVVNEAVLMPIYDRHENGITRLCKQMGRIALIRTLFETARECGPEETLLLNDFDISPAYDILIEGCLAAGIRIDAIGIQSHMHQGYWGQERTQEILERFERFHLPIHFSENTLLSGALLPADIVDLNDYQVEEWPTTPAGEARQAQEVVLHYKTLFAHPAVQAITWWDLTDGGWLNAPAGLLRRDQSPKPAYDELLKLIKGEWWLAPTRMTTDAAGQLTFRGFLGAYELSLDGHSVTFSVEEKGAAAVSLDL